MKPKTIGIVGGAGPLAGVALLERFFRKLQVEYGCFQDADFPKVLLVSFPFSDMLGEEIDKGKVAQELRSCLEFLKINGASLLAIACNTLHTFLDEEMKRDLISLPELTCREVERLGKKKPMILCSSTSRKGRLYDMCFPCTYPDLNAQAVVDGIIVSILKGESSATQLSSLINTLETEVIVLGCTELSLYSNECCGAKKIIDPMDLLAKELIKKSFN